MLRGLLAFTHYAYAPAHKDSVVKATAQVMNLDEKYTRPAWDEILKKKWLPEDLRIDRANIVSYLDGYQKLGAKLPPNVASDKQKYVNSLVDDSYLRRAANAKSQSGGK